MKCPLIPPTSWLVLQAPDLMEGGELVAGTKVFIFVCVVDEPHATVVTPGKSVGQNTLSTQSATLNE